MLYFPLFTYINVINTNIHVNTIWQLENLVLLTPFIFKIDLIQAIAHRQSSLNIVISAHLSILVCHIHGSMQDGNGYK